jgi:transposase
MISRARARAQRAEAYGAPRGKNLYYRWSREFLEAGKKRLAGDTAREATSDEVKELKAEARQLKETLAEVLIENRLLKKSVLGDGEDAS